MLEVWSGDNPLAELEAHLDDAGFFGTAEDFVADVFLGYALSHSLRRSPLPAPAEPCRLPLLAARIHPVDERPRLPGPFRIGGWKRSWDDEGYAAAIESVQDAIARGDVYQVNLVQHLHAPFEGEHHVVIFDPAEALPYECATGYLSTYVFGSAEACLGETRRGEFIAGQVGFIDYLASLAAEPHFAERRLP